MYTSPNADLVPNETPADARNSGLGIASFALALISLVATIAVFGYAGYLEISTAGGISEESAEAIMIGLAIFACIGMMIVGLVLGLVALFQKGKRRTFAAIGVGLNGIFVLIVVAAIWFGINAA